MKTTPLWIISAGLIFSLAGCYETASEKAFERAGVLLAENKVVEAEKEYQKLFAESADKKIVLESAEKLYEIAFFKTKNYKKAVQYLATIVANSESFADSIEALKKKALIEHKNLLQYEAAIASYSRLLGHSGLAMAEENEYRLNLVKCLFAINKFEQAKMELKPLYDSARPPETRMAAKSLEGSILQAEGQVAGAVLAYTAAYDMAVLDKDKQDILINIAMCYEQTEQYAKALEALNKIQLSAAFLDDKKRQLERLAKFKDRRLNR